MRPVLYALLLLASLGTQAGADPARIDRLIEVTRLSDVLEIMQAEGISHSQNLEQDLFPGQGGAAWQAEAARIHDADRALAEMRGEMIAGLDGDALDGAIAFFDTELGQKIIAAEISARSAMLDEALDEAAQATAADMVAAGDPRIDLVRRFIAANDLIESNVVGGLNSNFAFFRGLVDGGAFDDDMTEDQMLAEVWQQEPDLRIETGDWLLSYLSLAYSALEDDELEAYIAASETPSGQAFNRLLFQSFDVLFDRSSYELGQAAARFMLAEDA